MDLAGRFHRLARPERADLAVHGYPEIGAEAAPIDQPVADTWPSARRRVRFAWSIHDFTAHLAIRCGVRAVSYCSRILCMPRGNPSPKLAITIDPDIHENVLAAAARDGVSVSAWMTAAAREALQRRAGLAAVARWEEQHGRFTTEEMNEARRSVRAQLRRSRTARRPA
jgi:hypothetical protein